MSDVKEFDQAMILMRTGDYHALRVLLIRHPKLVHKRDSSNATLLLKLFELPGEVPNVAKLARVLLVAGSSVNVQRNKRSPIPLLLALQAKQLDAVTTLLEFGASFRTYVEPLSGTILEHAIELCKVNSADKVFTLKLRELIQAYTGGNLS